MVWIDEGVPRVLTILLEYGAHAKYTVPKLAEIAEYFDQREKDFPKHLSLKKAEDVRKAIRLLQAMDERQKAEIKLISITDG